MALSDKQKKINRITRNLKKQRYFRHNIVAHRVSYGTGNDFEVALRLEDGTFVGLCGFFDGAGARSVAADYRAMHAAKAKDLVAELREVKAS